MSSSLKNKAVKGISWNLLEKVGINGIKFLLGIVLARLLMPEDFGLIAIITVFFSISEVLVNSGFGQAYIQKKDVDETDANTVFLINLGISITLYCILYLTAPSIASFYDEIKITKLIRILGLIIIINSFNIIQIAQIRRELSFKRKTITSITSVALSGTLGIIAALSNLGVWSLVIQQLANRTFLTLGLYFTSRWKPKIQFSIKSFKELFSFGAWLLAANVIQRIFDNIYRLTIGKFYPANELGYFTKAKQFQGLVSEQFVWSIGIVAFPVFSRVQDKKDKIGNSLLKFTKYTSFITVPVLTALLVVSEPFIKLLLTSKWAAMIPYLKTMCLIGMVKPIHDMNIQSIEGIGKSKLAFILGMTQHTFRIINILIFYKSSVIFIIWGELVLITLTFFINSIFTQKYLAVSIYKYFKELKWIFFFSFISGLIGNTLFNTLENIWIQFFIVSFTILFLYTLLMYFFQRKFMFEILSLKKEFLNKKKL